jgi:hypothetical protein
MAPGGRVRAAGALLDGLDDVMARLVGDQLQHRSAWRPHRTFLVRGAGRARRIAVGVAAARTGRAVQEGKHDDSLRYIAIRYIL